jgi:hypothetical protein
MEISRTLRSARVAIGARSLGETTGGASENSQRVPKNKQEWPVHGDNRSNSAGLNHAQNQIDYGRQDTNQGSVKYTVRPYFSDDPPTDYKPKNKNPDRNDGNKCRRIKGQEKRYKRDDKCTFQKECTCNNSPPLKLRRHRWIL